MPWSTSARRLCNPNSDLVLPSVGAAGPGSWEKAGFGPGAAEPLEERSAEFRYTTRLRLPTRVVTLSATLEHQMSQTTIGVKVDEATRDRLRALAKARDRTPHWLMRTALLEYLEREEQAERERVEDAARWDRYVLTGEAVPHERVQEWLRGLAEGRDAGCPR